MDELLFYQLHANYPIPDKLKGEIFESNIELKLFDNCNKLNLFVGANNSGKSRIMREILKTATSTQSWSKEVIEFVQHDINKFINELTSEFTRYGIDIEKFAILSKSNGGSYIGAGDITNKYFNASPKHIVANYLSLYNNIMDLIKVMGAVTKHISDCTFRGYLNPGVELVGPPQQNLINPITEAATELQNLLSKKYSSEKLKYNKIYIPSFRTLRVLGLKGTLRDETRREYEFPDNSILIETGEDFARFISENKNAAHSLRNKVKKFEIFLSEYFFNHEQVEITEFKAKPNFVHIKIGAEREQPIYNLGDGLQMIIILTYPFFENDCGIVAIEEPELYIHPGLQRRLMDFFTNHPATRDFQIFMATHSNHFLDYANHSNSVSVFNVRKELRSSTKEEEQLPIFHIENVARGNENSLNLLGVNNSSVYLANCSIWVEGVTDKLYLSKYLSEYAKKGNLPKTSAHFKDYQEGIHYSFVFSGGDSIVHWDFDEDATCDQISKSIIVKNLCGKAFVIVDDDFNKNQKRKEILSKLLQDRLFVLSVPEIENLLAPVTIIETLKKYSRLDQFDIVINEPGKIKSLRLGSYIDEYILSVFKPSRTFAKKKYNSSTNKSYSLKSSDKLDFCEKAVRSITFETMTEEAKELAKRIIEFVIKCNASGR